MRRFLKSIHSRLVLLICLVALPGALTVVYMSVIERDHAIKEAQEEALKTTEITTTFQSLLVKRTENFLKNLATFDAVLTPESPDCSALLADIIKIKDIYINIGVPKANGDLICNAHPNFLDETINVADRPYIQQAISTRQFSIGEYQIDRAANVASINFAYPIFDPVNNELVSIAVAVLSLDWWSKQLSESRLPTNSIAFITDREDKIIAVFPNNPDLLGTKLSMIQPGLYHYHSASELDNQSRVYIKKPLFTDSQLVNIIVGIPFQEELDAINSRLILTGLTLLFIIFAMIIIASLGIQKTLVTPLRNLIQSTKDLEQGKDIKTLPLQGASELVALQRSFSVMAKTRLDAERKLFNSQKLLLKSENEFSEHIKKTPLGCISWDKNLICTKWNKSAERIFGYKAHEAIGKHASDLILLPELQEELWNIYQLLLTQKGGENNTNKNLTKAGDIITCEWHSTPILDQHGSVIGVTSLVQNVTKDKQNEEQLKLAASVFSHAREGIIITDTKGDIIDVNQTFVNITGYSKKEVLGKNPSILKSDRQSDDFYQKLWLSISKHGFWCGEIWNKRKNNEIYAQLLTISAVNDENGNVKNYVAIFTDISEFKEQQLKLEHMAHYDVLTDLPNRTLLADRLRIAISHSKRNEKLLAVVFLDLDGFKEINDSHGHSLGDELLVIIASRLKETIRECDTLSRFGGDEFVAVLADLQTQHDFSPIVNRMLKAASVPVTIDNLTLKVSASIGVTLYPADQTDADQLIRHADQAMYLAKQKGKNCYHLFDIKSEDAIKVRNQTLFNIKNALNKGEFVLFYQPKVNMQTGEVVGAEALIRWQHPQRGLLSPAEFLPFIENHQLSIEVGEWVIEEALQQIGKWQKNNLMIPISVNVGALQIQQRNFADRLKALLMAYPEISPSYLQLEVLETSALGDLLDASETMKKCIKLGISFAIDDFGTGYSSLTYLRRLPASLIKIDQIFIRDMLINPEDRAIVAGIVALAKSFNRKVIAEGVETIEHGITLLQLGCELAQGYGIARPMPAQDIIEWSANWRTEQVWKTWSDDKQD
ncbi:EAL domain-containing protein [Aliiglaciecola sp. SL4]|uniref:EAL domain-containing protein n=1 Tax=Aliiglaciecola sp. SL4 TaxID=3239806 RepID=UPI00355B65A7